MKSKWLTSLPLVAVAGMFAACGGGGHESSTASKSSSSTTEPSAPAMKEEEPAEAGDYAVMAVTNGGKVMGKVTFNGDAPEGELLPITKDPNACGTEKEILNVKVGDGGALKEAVVWLADITSGKDMPSNVAAIDQKDCEYTPHVQAMTVGGALEITNSDPVLHNVHAYGDGGAKSLFNLAQPNGAGALKPKLKKAGPVEVKCDVHSWMQAWVFVSPHPYYAVTGDDGMFSIGDVPAGEYTLKVWQEELGEKEMKVTVSAGGDATADFEFQG